MDKEEAKHLSEVLKAYSEDKIVQIRTCKGWEDVLDNKITFWGHPEDYRIKPEPKYRPYANAEEFLKAQKEHGPYFSWTMEDGKLGNQFKLPSLITDMQIEGASFSISYSSLLQGNYHWQDGYKCGILKE